MSNTLSNLSRKIGRRGFLKLASLGATLGATSAFASADSVRPATKEEVLSLLVKHID